MNDEAREPAASKVCAELRSKKWYFLDRPPQGAGDVLDASNDCWCARTQMRIGPDREIVHPDDCGPVRACFRPIHGDVASLA